MVIWSEKAEIDLINILYALITWQKHKPLSLYEADCYIRDIRVAGDAICKLSYHSSARYETHKAHGDKVYRYTRNKNTQWYIIYNWNDISRTAYVNKIINNYLTISEN